MAVFLGGSCPGGSCSLAVIRAAIVQLAAYQIPRWWCHSFAVEVSFVLTLVKHLLRFRMKTSCWMAWRSLHVIAFVHVIQLFSNACDKERPSGNNWVKIGQCSYKPRHQVLARFKDVFAADMFLASWHVVMWWQSGLIVGNLKMRHVTSVRCFALF